MLKWMIRRRLAAFERDFGYDASYIKHILDTDFRAFLKFVKAASIGHFRRDVPKDVFYAVGAIGIISEDCGPCTQLGVTMALREGVDPKLVAAVIAGDDAALPPSVLLGVRFARATLAHAPEADDLRDEIERTWGPRAIISLAFALTGARIYPTVKYALGYGKSCQRVVVDGATIIPPHARTARGSTTASTSGSTSDSTTASTSGSTTGSTSSTKTDRPAPVPSRPSA